MFIRQLPSLGPTPAQVAQIKRKYGMFIHFGINTFNNTEWSDGSLPVNSYNPPKIDAKQWIKTAYDAGMNYVILVCKHHDGFTLWNSSHTQYGVAFSPHPTDVVQAVSEACKTYGIQLGLYYSLWDRNTPCYSDDQAYIDYMKKQMTELMDGRYGEIVELWLDGGWDKTSSRWGLETLYDHVKKLQPLCSVGVNITIGKFDSQETNEEDKPFNYKKWAEMKYFPSDFRLFDPYFTKEGKADPKLYTHNGQSYYLPFEATICIRNMTNWFWDPQYTSDPTVTPRFIADKYNHLTEQNNNLVVNCAPNINGVLEEYDRQTLLEAGRMIGIIR